MLLGVDLMLESDPKNLVLYALLQNRFLWAARITSRPYKQVFVGAVQSRTAPTVRFPAKKNSNLQFKIALLNVPRPTFRTAFALPNAP